MRSIPQGTPGRADARAHHRARAHRQPRRGRPAAGAAALIGAIVAGGGSTRFGGEAKGLREVAGVRIIDRAASALRPVVSEIVLVANAPDAARWLPGARIVRDLRTERASVVGIHSAILAAAGASALVVAWDMPFVPTALLEHLRSALRPGIDAVIPEGPHGPEPFCAAYAPSAVAAIEHAIERGAYRLADAVATLPRIARIDATEVARFGPAERIFFNVNDVADLEAANRMARDS